MATAKFFLDRRRIADDKPSPLKIAVRNKKSQALISIGISLLPKQWDNDTSSVTIDHPMHKALNARISLIKGKMELGLMDLSERGGLSSMTADEIKRHILMMLNPDDHTSGVGSFIDYFHRFIETKKGGTKRVYEHTISRITAFCPNIDCFRLEDITVDWLTRFETFLSKTAPSKNARNIHLRNIRAVFNYAIDDEATAAYPFRRFKIRPEETRKRSLSVEELRKFISMEVEEYQQFYKDMFLLSFCLIGINAVDLTGLSRITKDGRIEYRRAKTHRKYSIKVEPEAMTIIDKYRGLHGLLCIADRWSDHRNFLHQFNKALKNMGDVERIGRGGKKTRTPAFPELSSYWARHTWATIAYNKCGISEDVIAQALGHASSHPTTRIYIDPSSELIDAANRKVLDYVFKQA